MTWDQRWSIFLVLLHYNDVLHYAACLFDHVAIFLEKAWFVHERNYPLKTALVPVSNCRPQIIKSSLYFPTNFVIGRKPGYQIPKVFESSKQVEYFSWGYKYQIDSPLWWSVQMALYITECSLALSALPYPMLPKKHSETENRKCKQKEHLQFLPCRDLDFVPQNVKASAGNSTMRNATNN